MGKSMQQITTSLPHGYSLYARIKLLKKMAKLCILQVATCKNVISSKNDSNTSFIQATVCENAISLYETVTNKCTMSRNA